MENTDCCIFQNSGGAVTPTPTRALLKHITEMGLLKKQNIMHYPPKLFQLLSQSKFKFFLLFKKSCLFKRTLRVPITLEFEVAHLTK